MDGIASCIENPSLSVGADAPVIAKAMELGALRHSQGFDEYQILKEFEILGGVMFAFLTRTVRDLKEPCENADLLVCAHRLFSAVTVIQQATITHFQELLRERVKEREDRLRGFNQALSHEMKNRFAAQNGVRVDIAEDFPAVEVAAAAVELCLTNLISNAVKYHDRSKSDRWVRVEGAIEAGDDATPRAVVRVSDNGLGVPAEERGRLFERFFRASHRHAAEIEGTGLGLSIVRQTAKALGGTAWAEFTDDHSTFAFSMPCRREADAAQHER